jgi:hypothetical protein
MVDKTEHEADSGRSKQEKTAAEVKATAGPSDDPDAFLVDYGDEVRYEPGTPKNQALFGQGKFADVNGTHAYDVDGTPIELRADVAADDYVLRFKGTDLRVPSDYVNDVVTAATSPMAGEALLDVYDEITEGQARRHVLQAFEERFPDDRVEQTGDGWIVDDTFIVTFDGENFLTDVDPIGPNGKEYDDSKQAVYLDLNTDEEREIVAPDGETYVLDPIEQRFLTTVEGLLYPEDYFGAELVEDIQQHKVESTGDTIEDLTEQATVTGFTDSKTGIHHGSSSHSFEKHRLSDLGVTDEVADLLWAHDYDHAGVVELHMRKDELVNRPDITIFEHAQDDDETMWEKVERTKENAPIPDDVRQTLNEMYQ